MEKLLSLHAEYAAAIDDDRLELWPEFFTDDGRYRITTRRNYAAGLPAGLVYADSRAMLRDRVLSLRKANIYEQQSYRHLIGIPRIVDRGPTCLRVETGFLVLRIVRDGPADTFASGRYVDEVVEQDGRLLLRSRDVVCDSSLIDTLLAIPL
jgi:anthranilate 1,2-dioxygenase small subunit